MEGHTHGKNMRGTTTIRIYLLSQTRNTDFFLTTAWKEKSKCILLVSVLLGNKIHSRYSIEANILT